MNDVLLAFAGEVGSVLCKACGADSDDDAICLIRAANSCKEGYTQIAIHFHCHI